MSIQQLSDAVGQLGVPIDRPVLSNLENKRRRTVSVAELNALAAALGVPRALLEFPVGRVDTVEPIPGIELSPLLALHWTETGRLGASHGDVVAPSSNEDAQLIQHYRRHRDLVGAWQMVEGKAESIRRFKDGDEATAALAQLERERAGTVGELRTLRELLRSYDLTPPELPRLYTSLALRQALGEDDEDAAS